jgi:hypothetical protein
MEDVDIVMELDMLAVLQEQVNAEPVQFQANAAVAEEQVVNNPNSNFCVRATAPTHLLSKTLSNLFANSR